MKSKITNEIAKYATAFSLMFCGESVLAQEDITIDTLNIGGVETIIIKDSEERTIREEKTYASGRISVETWDYKGPILLQHILINSDDSGISETMKTYDDNGQRSRLEWP